MSSGLNLLTPEIIREAASIVSGEKKLCAEAFFRGDDGSQLSAIHPNISQCCAVGAVFLALRRRYPELTLEEIFNNSFRIQELHETHYRMLHPTMTEFPREVSLISFSDKYVVEGRPDIVIQHLLELAEFSEKRSTKE